MGSAVNVRAAAASVSLCVIMVIAAATLAGCGPNQTYSCTEDGLDDLESLGSALTSAFPEAGTPTAYSDCDSSGKASVEATHPGSVASLEGTLPPAWHCGPGKGDAAWDRHFRCTVEGQPTQVIIEAHGDDTAAIYLQPRAPAD